METSNRLIEDYYDAGLNGAFAGHQIRKNPAVAISWPSHVKIGDMLPCYDCHNPHGSRGYDGVRPNGYLLSDERPGWSGIVDPTASAEESRRFCLGCHVPSDGMPGSRSVEGIVMNAISTRSGHVSSDAESCHGCHGADYSGPTSVNVHHPASGNDPVEAHTWEVGEP
jgi:hypothetical protein